MTEDLVIIGAGPYGLSLAAHLAQRNMKFRIFGDPMGTWARHMPRNMTLKSEGFASNLSGPSKDSTLAAWSQRTGVAYDDREIPVTLDNFLSYADWFRARYVPNLEDRQVVSLDGASHGFTLTLDDGERVEAKAVVLAVGVSWFAYTPKILSALPRALLSHSYEHREANQFASKDVALIGTGSSAIDLAHLLNEAGASPRIVGRASEIEYNIVPDADRHTLMYRLQNPPSPIGRGWRSYFCAQAPLAFYRLPQHLKDRAIKSHMHAAGGWFMREHVEGRIPTSLGCSIARAEAKDGRAVLTLTNKDGKEEVQSFDHVIAATGYRVDLKRVPFLTENLRAKIDLVRNAPLVSDEFQTSVPGLYAIGLSAMQMFGPLLRFMVGAEFVAPRLAGVLEWKARRSALKAAA